MSGKGPLSRDQVSKLPAPRPTGVRRGVREEPKHRTQGRTDKDEPKETVRLGGTTARPPQEEQGAEGALGNDEPRWETSGGIKAETGRPLCLYPLGIHQMKFRNRLCSRLDRLTRFLPTTLAEKLQR